MARFLAFGRHEFDQPLTQVGAVFGDDAAQAVEVVARRLGEDWVELTLIPDTEVRWVITGNGQGEEGSA